MFREPNHISFVCFPPPRILEPGVAQRKHR